MSEVRLKRRKPPEQGGLERLCKLHVETGKPSEGNEEGNKIEDHSNPEGHTQHRGTAQLRGGSSDHLNAQRAKGKAL